MQQIMKKILISISMLMLSCCVIFAQADPKAYAKELKQIEKSVKEAQRLADTQGSDLNQAISLIEKAMKFPEITAQPEVWNAAGSVQKKLFEAEQQKLYLKQQPDYDKMYNSLYNTFDYYFKCDEVERTAVDKKGRPVKVKFNQPNAKTLRENRGWLINGGVKYYNEDKNNEAALKFFSMYIDSATNPIFNGDETLANDTLIPQIAYYASLASMQMKNYESVLKYTPLVKKDTTVSRYAYEFTASAYKALGDTAKWIAELQEGIKIFPSHTYFFGNLIDYYNNSGKYDEALKFADNMVKQDPNDSFMQYVKGYLCQNLQKYDDAIAAYQAAITIDPNYAEAHSNLGLVYCQLARDFGDKAESNMKSPQYKIDQEKIRDYYRSAQPHYEKVRLLKPENKEMWLNGLYSIYYMLNMGAELEEIEKIMNE